ncbi:unnamed protein product [Absidia cylindrospora]
MDSLGENLIEHTDKLHTLMGPPSSLFNYLVQRCLHIVFLVKHELSISWEQIKLFPSQRHLLQATRSI